MPSARRVVDVWSMSPPCGHKAASSKHATQSPPDRAPGRAGDEACRRGCMESGRDTGGPPPASHAFAEKNLPEPPVDSPRCPPTRTPKEPSTRCCAISTAACVDEAGGPLRPRRPRRCRRLQHPRQGPTATARLVTVCTGRPLPFAECICRAIANDVLPCVCENGAWVYDPVRQWLPPGSRNISDDHTSTPPTAFRALVPCTHYGPEGVSSQPGKHASVSLYHADPEFLEHDQARPRGGLPSKTTGPSASAAPGTTSTATCGTSARAPASRSSCNAPGLIRRRLAGIGDTQRRHCHRRERCVVRRAGESGSGDRHATLNTFPSLQQIDAVVEMLEMLSGGS